WIIPQSTTRTVSASLIISAGTPVPDKSTGQLAFSGSSTGGYELFTMDSDGTHQKKLTSEKADDGRYGLTWSPNGAQIAYSAYHSGFYQIWIMDADGKNQHALVKESCNCNMSYPRWS